MDGVAIAMSLNFLDRSKRFGIIMGLEILVVLGIIVVIEII
jgi:hypothetical protein